MKNKFASGKFGSLNYRLYQPPGSNEQLPLVIFLHGAGQCGTDNSKQLGHGIFNFINDERPCYILAPQIPSRKFDIMELFNLFNHVCSTYPIDLSRIYVTGVSMGAHITWLLTILDKLNPSLFRHSFAAIAPVSGACKTVSFINQHSVASLLITIPTWIMHGAIDKTVPVICAQTIYDDIKLNGGNPNMTIYLEVGHDAWRHAYTDLNFMNWLFEQKLK